MTWPIDIQALEQAIVRNCSPTLAALKPASLFTFPGSFTAQAPESQNEASARRQALLEAVKYCQRQVSNAGVAIRILAWKRCGALVYVYRPRELAAYLVDQRAAHPLENEGYRPGDLDACLDELSRRLQNRSSESAKKGAKRVRDESKPCPCSNRVCRSEFPHEIGFFLGYPYEDVIGFIENRGQNYLEVGPWKVYANQNQARRTFARYRRCARIYARAYRCGQSLRRLTVSPRQAGAASHARDT
ncbi:DUF3793 family protein [Collinsella bouchesdurhonensis]|uniref:DUF3793 family protein n=1 Tax=Collinsella bouchesdurhonensis TaxID=1907654 RepID=UPI0011072D91|nr:DUF3793 family protein [Collinsella bouchesdurhonensis]